MMTATVRHWAIVMAAALAASCTSVPDADAPLAAAESGPGVAHPEIWPEYDYPVPRHSRG